MRGRTTGPTIAALLLGLLAAASRATERPVTDVDAMAGKALYQRWCSACHGERGDGAGPAAEFLDPRPRDFTKKLFKFRTTASGQPPATADVLRVIERGLPGSAMPPFAFLPEADRRKIGAYVLYVADLIDGPEPTPIAVPAPPAASADTVARGKQFYADAGCNSCHGDTGKGDGSTDLTDTDGRPIKPRDLTEGTYRGGGDRLDLYYRIATGLDGTPMPAYGDALGAPDLFALVDYVLSLKAPPAVTPLPSDPIAAGRAVTAKHGCRGCHALDDGSGGDVGPDLRFSALKLDPAWERTFLKAPDEYGKIYPWRVSSMPRIPLTQEEVDALGRYVAAMGKHADGQLAAPDVHAFPAAKLEEGKNLFVLKCAQCHALGKVIETPPAAQQGPDLIRVAGRLDYTWASEWIRDPKKIDPKTRMTATDLTPEQADAVRMFVWKASIEAGSGAQHATAAAAATP